MDDAIKEYAVVLHEDARMESGKILQDARRDLLTQTAARNTGNLPLSGPTIASVIALHVAHIGRCMAAKLDSFKQAYAKRGTSPSEEDFTFILDECRAVRERQIGFAVKAMNEFIKSHGGGVPLPLPPGHIESSLTSGSGHAHDDTLRKWKIWRAEMRVKPSAPSSPSRKLDSRLPVYDRAEFDKDWAVLAAKSNSTSPLSVLFADLDKFKSINDGPGGHAAGDRALVAFAKALLATSDGKGNAYRYGGDEFRVLLPNHALAEAMAVAERLVREVGMLSVEGLDGCSLSTSVGVACFPEPVGDAAGLVDAADKAMYTAKKAGGNRAGSSTTS